MTAPSIQTELCRQMGIRYPIFSVGFGQSAGPELASAVSNAGGCGVIGASGMQPDDIRVRLAGTRALTDRPFGVNLIIDLDPAEEDADRAFIGSQIAALAGAHVPLVVLFWGDPGLYVGAAHAGGMLVFIQVGSIEEARHAAAAGVDGIIAQGLEAGGHVRGTTSIWEILPTVVAAVHPLPVLSSGGIGNGAAIARALRLGAQGVSLGTRFVASREAWFHPGYKERLVSGRAEDTVYTRDLYDLGWPDAPHRTLRNKIYEEWDAAGRPPSGLRPGEGTTVGTQLNWAGVRGNVKRYAVGSANPTFDGDIEYTPLWAGESVSDVNNIKSAAEIVQDLVRETEAALIE